MFEGCIERKNNIYLITDQTKNQSAKYKWNMKVLVLVR